MTFGRRVMGSTGNMMMVVAEDMSRIRWKTGGVTVDWNTVPSVLTDTALGDGNTILAGQKGIRYGAVLTKITASGLYGPWTKAAPGATTQSGATVIGATQMTVASGTDLYPGDVIQVDTAGNLELLRIRAIAGAIITLDTPTTINHANGVAVVKLDDGRATLAAGSAFVVNMTVLQNAPNTLAAFATNYPAVLYGGKVWSARLQVGGTNQPTLAQLLAACPELHPIAV